MHLSKIALLIATGLSQVQGAAILARDPTPNVLLHTKVLGNGTLEYWGIPSPEDADRNWDEGWGLPGPVEPPSPAVQRRCGGNDVHCSNANLARSDVCQALVDDLARNPRAGVPPNVRAIVRHQGSFSCYAAWYDVIGNMVFGYLTNAASKTLGICGPGGTVSGFATDVSLNNVCTVQCLSSAPGCFF